MSRRHEVPSWREAETRQTIREWNQRMTRLNSIDMGHAQPRVSPAFVHGGPGYAGLYQYMSTGVMVGSGGELRGRQVEPTAYERWVSSRAQAHGHGRRSSSSKSVPEEGRVLVSPAECKEIQRAFEAADVSRDGYLDCEELKTFMEFRRSPITHWEAKKLLKAIDPQDGAFINLDQVMFLVFHCGVATEQERPMCRRQFEKALTRLSSISSGGSSRSSFRNSAQLDNYVYQEPPPAQGHYSRQPRNSHVDPEPDSPPFRLIRPRKSQIIEEPIPMDGAKSFFEDMASEVEANSRQELLYQKYRQEVRSGTRSLPESEPVRPKISGPPGWEKMVLPSQSEPEPQPDFKVLRTTWQDKVSRVTEEEELRKKEFRPKVKPETATGSEKAEPNSIDLLTFPEPPLSPLSCREAVEVTQTPSPFDIRKELGRILEKRIGGPPVPPKPTRAKEEVKGSKADENNNRLLSPVKENVSCTHLLFRKEETKLSQVSHLEIN